MTLLGPTTKSADLEVSPTEQARRSDLKAFRVVTTTLAVATVTVAALIGLVHEHLHLTHDEARNIASTLLVIGIADTLILCFWERLFHATRKQL